MIINWNTNGNKTYLFFAGPQSLIGSWVEEGLITIVGRTFNSFVTRAKIFFSVVNKEDTFNSFATKTKTFFSKIVN